MDETKYSPAFKEAAKIRVAKRDYGSIKESFPFGDLSFAQMVHIKTKRLVNLAPKAKPNCEPIEDSLLDLINYASYWYEWRKGMLDE